MSQRNQVFEKQFVTRRRALATPRLSADVCKIQIENARCERYIKVQDLNEVSIFRFSTWKNVVHRIPDSEIRLSFMSRWQDSSIRLSSLRWLFQIAFQPRRRENILHSNTLRYEYF